ncbi:MAG TPA: penicillin-binding transpeptidase domain-containing protein, partial [Fimbriimonadaceae bacterium]|nr:penicillin-binding transpeptidase domain-containing protein [Fimbriimonadaceae bacterium]
MSVIHAPKQPELTGRHLVFPIAICVAFVALLLRLWYLQVVKADELAERAEYYRRSKVQKLAPRGLIYDRKGVLLAGVEPKIVVTAKPAVVKQNPWVLRKLATMLGVPLQKLEDKVRDASFRPHLPAPIHVGADIRVATRIAESGPYLPGIGVENQPMRFYPDPKSFAHLMGYVWVPSSEDVKRLGEHELKPADYVGKDGIEYVYERELMGRPGADRFEVDAKRRPTRLTGRDNAIPGKALMLTLDNDLQQLAVQLLGPHKGAVVAIEPLTGEVLCLASNPVYDLTLFQGGISSKDWDRLNKDPDVPLFNRATQSAYAPGSTFK